MCWISSNYVCTGHQTGPAGVTFVLCVKYRTGKNFYLGEQLLFDGSPQRVLLWNMWLYEVNQMRQCFYWFQYLAQHSLHSTRNSLGLKYFILQLTAVISADIMSVMPIHKVLSLQLTTHLNCSFQTECRRNTVNVCVCVCILFKMHVCASASSF